MRARKVFGAAFLGGAIGGGGANAETPDENAEEERFFDILWRCGSPVLVERDAAEEELERDFAEFEQIWQNREFLTNGEICAEARWRFETTEARRREATLARARDGVRATSEFVGDAAERERRFRVSWDETTRVVYLAPEWSAAVWRDADGAAWRPRDRFNSPEISPEFDAREAEFATPLERAETPSAESTENPGALVALLGVDRRELRVSPPDAETERPRVVQNGDLRLEISAPRRKPEATLVEIRLEYAEAFDAFDSHRVAFVKRDFALEIAGRRVEPSRLRTRAKTPRGVALELEFPAKTDGERLTLVCLAPRFFLALRKSFE